MAVKKVTDNARTLTLLAIIIFLTLIGVFIYFILYTPVTIHTTSGSNIVTTYFPANTSVSNTTAVNQISAQSVSTVINGVATITSLIFAFSASLTGLFMKYVVGKQDRNKQNIFVVMLCLLPGQIVFLLVSFLIQGVGGEVFFGLAYKLSLIALTYSLLILLIIISFAAYFLNRKESSITSPREEETPSEQNLTPPSPLGKRFFINKHMGYGVVTYAILFILLVVTVTGSLLKISPQSDTLLIALTTIFTVFSVAFLLICELPNIISFEFGPTGVKAIFRDLANQALKIKDTSAPSPQVQEYVNNIAQSDFDPKTVFLNLASAIELKLSAIAELKGFPHGKYSTVSEMTGYLVTHKVVSKDIAYTIMSLWQIRNGLAHRVRVDKEDLQIAIETGKLLLAKLAAIEAINKE